MSGKWENPSVPHSGWECIDIQDLGEPVMTCQMCEQVIFLLKFCILPLYVRKKKECLFRNYHT